MADIIVCDRCGEQLVDAMTCAFLSIGLDEFDVCSECAEELRDFLKGDCGCGKGAGCPDRG